MYEMWYYTLLRAPTHACFCRFWNEATKNLSSVEVTNIFHKLAKKTFPKLNDIEWEKEMNGYGGTGADIHAREWWKYSCSRGVTGTPSYVLNGVPFEADSDWTYEQWKEVIDPLIKGDKADAKPLTVAKILS